MCKNNELRLVKCCGSCAYSRLNACAGMFECSAYVNRIIRLFEVCETFFPDVDVWEGEGE
jgi:hypothetical protein